MPIDYDYKQIILYLIKYKSSMMFHKRKYIIFFNAYFNFSQVKRAIKKQSDSLNEFIEFDKEDNEEIVEHNNNSQINTNIINDNQFNFLQHKRNHSLTLQNIPLKLHDSDKEESEAEAEESNRSLLLNKPIKEGEIIDDPEVGNIVESDSNDSNLKGIIHDKIKQIKEFKDHQRKCLLQENEDNLYGKSKAPKDMLNDIYQLISENAIKSEDSESENEKMITQWENEQYKSGVNTNKIKVEHNQSVGDDDSKENMNDVFNKIRKKMDIDVNSILSCIQSELMRIEGDLEYYRKKNSSYQEEISNIKNNESIIDNKIEFYIDQYFKLKNVFFDLLRTENIDKDKSHDDEDNYYLSN